MSKILVVDDEMDILTFVRRALESKGHEVMTASDGAEALRVFPEHEFDLVISDIKMPVMDGIALALSLKAKSPDLPIILMTGYADQKERASGLQSLISDVLNKPFELETLYQCVEQAIAKVP